MSLVDSVAQYIATDLALGALGSVVFEDHMPSTPDTCLCVYSTGGGPAALTQGDNTDSPSFQVRSRSLDADVALGNLLTIYQALHGLTETTVHGTHVKLLWALQSNPMPLGRDELHRFEFTQNFRALTGGVTR